MLKIKFKNGREFNIEKGIGGGYELKLNEERELLEGDISFDIFSQEKERFAELYFLLLKKNEKIVEITDDVEQIKVNEEKIDQEVEGKFFIIISFKKKGLKV